AYSSSYHNSGSEKKRRFQAACPPRLFLLCLGIDEPAAPSSFLALNELPGHFALVLAIDRPPAEAVFLDQALRLLSSPRAGRIVLQIVGLLRILGPGRRDLIDILPSQGHFVPPGEVRRIPARRIVQQALVGFRRIQADLAALAEVHRHWHDRALRARLLGIH